VGELLEWMAPALYGAHVRRWEAACAFADMEVAEPERAEFLRQELWPLRATRAPTRTWPFPSSKVTQTPRGGCGGWRGRWQVASFQILPRPLGENTEVDPYNRKLAAIADDRRRWRKRGVFGLPCFPLYKTRPQQSVEQP
jgi:hypothetical protein